MVTQIELTQFFGDQVNKNFGDLVLDCAKSRTNGGQNKRQREQRNARAEGVSRCLNEFKSRCIGLQKQVAAESSDCDLEANQQKYDAFGRAGCLG